MRTVHVVASFALAVFAAGCGLVLDIAPPDTDASVDTSVVCIAGDACDTGNACELGVIACLDGVPRCVPVGPAPSGTLCREARGTCDLAEACDGASVACPVDARKSGSVCRPASSACDVEETCTGASDACPPDAVAALGEPCASGFCDGDGTCVSDCPLGMPCATGNPCERGVVDCTDGPRCVGAGPASADVVCRAAMGECDVAERCTGDDTVCPPDERLSNTTICRRASSACDLAERCDGMSSGCPSDERAPVGTGCAMLGSAPGVCDASGACVSASATACTPGAYCATSTCQPGWVDCTGPGGAPRCVASGAGGVVGDYTPCDLCGSNFVCFGGYCMPYMTPPAPGSCGTGYCCPGGCSMTECVW